MECQNCKDVILYSIFTVAEFLKEHCLCTYNKMINYVIKKQKAQ